MRNIIIIIFILLGKNALAQETSFNVGSRYDFPTFKQKLSKTLSEPDTIDKFSIVINGNIPSKRFEKLLRKFNSVVSVFDTHKLIVTPDTILVNHVYYWVYFYDLKKTYVFLRSYSKDLVRITGEQTIFSMLGTSESPKSLNIYTIK
ncbi:MAG: hypothetical protein RLQ12_23590 [Cyclobacteriaceae bacterium]